MAVVVIGISYFSLILGELVPKRIALSHPERIAAALARLMSGLARVDWLRSRHPRLERPPGRDAATRRSADYRFD